MSTGRLTKCCICGKPLNLEDPNNMGYCGGHYCKDMPDQDDGGEAPAFGDKIFAATLNRPFTPKKEEKPVGNRHQRRAAEVKARKKKKGKTRGKR